MSSEEVELLSDSKYRQFIAAVEKALRSFESTSEWADLISALGKLNKVLLSNSQFVIIPRKLMIGKRLSQCMHPALPSGVHLKALETYDLIFKRIGKKRLAQDLFIYSAGLFPLMGHSAMSVKPLLMKLYEEHFLPLGVALVPSLPGLLLGLLPGIEEGSDYNEKTIFLLEKFSTCTDKNILFEALWQSVITTPTTRLPATTFLLSQLDKHLPLKEQQHLMGKNHAFMVQGVCFALNDKLALVQRNLLDFLVQLLPLHTSFLQRHHLSDIMTAALGVLLRRDMSLNRRLYAWILGTNGEGSAGLARSDSVNEEDTVQYFEVYGKPLVVEALKTLFRQHIDTSADSTQAKKTAKIELLKPFRILLNLLDKPEIGSAILEDVLIEVFKNLFRNSQHFGRDAKGNESDVKLSGDRASKSSGVRKPGASKENMMEELTKTANLLFNTFEPYFMWDYIAKLLAECSARVTNSGDKKARDEVLGNESPVDHAPEHKVSGDKVPKDKAPKNNVAGNEGPWDKVPGNHTLGNKVPEDRVSRPKASQNKVCRDKVPGNKVLDGEISLGECTKKDGSEGADKQAQDWLEVIDIFRLTDFILNIVALESSVETESKHWPELLANIIQELTKGCQSLTLEELEAGILLCSKLLSKVTPSTNVVVDGGTLTPSPRHTVSPCFGPIGLDDNTEIVDGKENDGSESFGSSCSLQESSEESKPRAMSRDEESSVDDSSRAGITSRAKGQDGKRVSDAASVDARDSVNEAFRTPRFERREKLDVGGKEILEERDKVKEAREGEEGGITDKESVEVSGAVKDKENVDKKRSQTTKESTDKKKNEKRRDGVKNEKLKQSKDKKDEEKKKSRNKEKHAEKGMERKVQGKRKKERNEKSEKAQKNENGVKAKQENGERSARSDVFEYDSGQVSQSATIRDCIKHFQTFLMEFFKWKILGSAKAEDILENDGLDRINKLKIVSQQLKQDDTCGKRIQGDECSGGNSFGPAKTYSAACKLLVELSCFPMQNKGTESETSCSIDKEKHNLPLWLSGLVACCCELNDFDIQSTSVATLLDLINLTLSVSPDTAGGTAGVTVIPILTMQEVMVIEQSDIYQVIANNLWAILGRPVTIHHRKAVELLIQLHNLTPSPHLCENVIGSSMVSDCKESRLEALKRFANLWHIAKSILSQSVGRTARGLRTFDRSLFVMLDGLESEEPEIRSLTKMWVSHSLEQGDIGRILEPLLLLLLHPSTARVSPYFSEREKNKVKAFLCKAAASQDTDGNGEEEDEEDAEKILDEAYEGYKEDTVGSRQGGELTSSGSEDPARKCEGAKKDANTDPCTAEKSNCDSARTRSDPNMPNYSRLSDIHKLHYSGKCDYQQILYAFRTLSCVLRVVPRQFVCAAAATSIGSSFGPYEERIKELLIRHKRSLLGKGFYGPLYGRGYSQTGSLSVTPPSAKFTIKPNTSKYLEILITISLYFIRSHYLPSSSVDPEFIEGNIKTQVASLECLSNLTWELVKLVRESGHGFGNFITDLLSRCRVQKAIVHCLAATTKSEGTSVESSQRSSDASEIYPAATRGRSDVSRTSFDFSRRLSEETVDQMILQSKLLEVVESLIVLENALLSCFEALTPDHLGNSDFEIIMKGGDEAAGVGLSHVEADASRFIQGKSLSSQEMLLNMVLLSLKAQSNFDMSSRWTGFVIECLPYLGADLKKWVVPVVLQMCCNLSDVTKLFNEANRKTGIEQCSPPSNKQFPPDHLLAVLAGLTSICHFCLLEALSSPVLATQPRAGGTGSLGGGQQMSVESNQKTVRSMQIFANLLHAFSSNSKTNETPCVENLTPLLEAREGLLSVLPRVIATLLSLWSTWNLDSPSESLPSSMALLGTAKALRQSILQLLTPIAMTHTIVFLASIADVWNTKKLPEKDLDSNSKSSAFLAVTDEQLRVISLVLDIKALSLEVVIDTVKQILHQELTNRDKGFEASLLQFFHEFLQRSPASHIAQAKNSFLGLLKDGLQLNLPPPAVFFLLINLHSYYIKVPGKEDRKSRKESQDVAQRLIEACTAIAGMSLGSSAWFSRNLSVISVPDSATEEQTADSETEPAKEAKAELTGKTTGGSSSSTVSKHSTQALVVLADVLASLLDMVFGREEKERVVNFLGNVMGNVTPYLRNHSVANVPSFRACCSLLASLSGYQYTRKAWRKETFDLVFEPGFFQMDTECIGCWRVIMDNLFTQDQASFRELMARATVTSSAAISFFGNHEQEMQQRAVMLKRLSLAVFSSEPDQYQSYLPEIQERLAECLRMPQVPVLHEQVFLFFRVLLVRMSDNMTSIWPMIISEMIHVFLLMESDLLQSDTPSRDQQMFYSETVLGASGYVNYSQEKWLGLYLSVCKLLDMALCLPPEQLPQFQMYRWAFEGATNELSRSDHVRNIGAIFTPYVARITKLLTKRKNIYVSGQTLECHAGRPLLTMYQLDSVDELLPFLRLLSTESRLILDLRSSERNKMRKGKGATSRNFIEKLIERDFLEPLKE